MVFTEKLGIYLITGYLPDGCLPGMGIYSNWVSTWLYLPGIYWVFTYVNTLHVFTSEFYVFSK